MSEFKNINEELRYGLTKTAERLNKQDTKISEQSQAIGELDALTNRKGLITFANPYTISSSGIWTGSSNTTHVIIGINGGDTLKLKANSINNTIFAVLSDKTIRDGKSAYFSANSNWNARKTLTKKTESEEFVMPSDAKYVYFTCDANNTNYLPESIKINGIEQNYVIREKIDSIANEIIRLNTEEAKNVKYKYQMTADDDIDSLSVAGYYNISSSAPYPSGTFPNGFKGQRLMLFSYITTNRFAQIMINKYGELAIRVFVSGAWSDWNVIEKASSRIDTMPFEYNHVVNSSDKQNTGKELTILSYNVGVYSEGKTSTKGMPSDVINEKMFNLKKFIMSVGADLMGLQEDTQYVDRELTKDAHAYVYKPMYPNKVTLGGTSAYTKAQMSNNGSRPIGNDRYMSWCEQVIDGKTLLFVSAHPSVDTSAHRDSEYDNIFNWVMGRQWEWCIIAGDFNSLESADRTKLTNLCSANGFTMSNGGYLGWLVTTPDNESIDNIMVSNKCIINDIVVHSSNYGELYSDHYPLSAKITLT